MKYAYIGIGLLSLIIGAIGTVLPILPTTPFLLITAFCFAMGSRRFHDWFITTKLYQKHLASYVRERTMTIKSKITILVYASAMLIIAFILINNMHVRLTILFIMVFKYYYFLLKIKTKEQD